jgi:cytochrome P450
MSRVAFDKGGPVMRVVRSLLGNGLITCPMQEHPAQRQALQPAFHRERLRAHANVMRDCALRVTERWRDGAVVDVEAEMLRLTAQVLVRTVIGTNDDDHAATVIADAMPDLVRGLFRRLVLPVNWIHRLPLSANHRFDRARRVLDSTIEHLLAASRAETSARGNWLPSLPVSPSLAPAVTGRTRRSRFR